MSRILCLMLKTSDFFFVPPNRYGRLVKYDKYRYTFILPLSAP
jgi:hypothetical protein